MMAFVRSRPSQYASNDTHMMLSLAEIASGVPPSLDAIISRSNLAASLAATATSAPIAAAPAPPQYRARATAALMRLAELPVDEAYGSLGEGVLALTQWRHDVILPHNDVAIRYLRTIAALTRHIEESGMLDALSSEDWNGLLRVLVAGRMPFAALEVARMMAAQTARPAAEGGGFVGGIDNTVVLHDAVARLLTWFTGHQRELARGIAVSILPLIPRPLLGASCRPLAPPLARLVLRCRLPRLTSQLSTCGGRRRRHRSRCVRCLLPLWPASWGVRAAPSRLQRRSLRVATTLALRPRWPVEALLPPAVMLKRVRPLWTTT